MTSILVAVAICVSFCIGLLSYKEVSGLTQIDLFFYDQFIKTQAADSQSDSVTVVDIDDASL